MSEHTFNLCSKLPQLKHLWSKPFDLLYKLILSLIYCTYSLSSGKYLTVSKKSATSTYAKLVTFNVLAVFSLLIPLKNSNSPNIYPSFEKVNECKE